MELPGAAGVCRAPTGPRAPGKGRNELSPPGCGRPSLHGSGLGGPGYALRNQQKRTRNPSSSADAGGGEEEAIPHVTRQEMESAGKGPGHCRCRHRSQHGWRGPGSPASSRPSASCPRVPGEVPSPFSRELASAAGSRRVGGVGPDSSAVRGAAQAGPRGTGQPAEQKRCTGGDSSFPLAAACAFTRRQLPARSLALSFMSFIRSISFQRVVRPQ